MPAHRFRDLGCVVDDVHALFDRWVEEGTFADALDAVGVEVLKLAVHEWVANLVQHAAFGRRRPEIRLRVERAGRGVPGLRCVIEDNSNGFDFERQIVRQRGVLGADQPSDRGRGLLMLLACTEDLTYEPAAKGRQRLAFVVLPHTAEGDAAPSAALAPLFASASRT
ncbi:MAG TPA: ATP-binding protein [Rubricoccaceae bacterium]|nr:ATP-binding protein [Rubricoccaceae bacterium]